MEILNILADSTQKKFISVQFFFPHTKPFQRAGGYRIGFLKNHYNEQVAFFYTLFIHMKKASDQHKAGGY